jgi:hypothetical protein
MLNPNKKRFLDSSNKFHMLLSFGEASALWSVDESTLRKAVAAGRLVEGVDCVKFGKQWVVYAGAMAKLYSGDWGPFHDHCYNLLHEDNPM